MVDCHSAKSNVYVTWRNYLNRERRSQLRGVRELARGFWSCSYRFWLSLTALPSSIKCSWQTSNALWCVLNSLFVSANSIIVVSAKYRLHKTLHWPEILAHMAWNSFRSIGSLFLRLLFWVMVFCLVLISFQRISLLDAVPNCFVVLR